MAFIHPGKRINPSDTAPLQEGTIEKRGGKFCVISSKGKNLGCKPTRKAAQKREKQIQFFKNVEKSSGGPGSLKAQVRKKSLL